MTAPGWYNAEGDPPGTQRYWDGTAWTGDPVYEPTSAAMSTAPPPPNAGGYAYTGGVVAKPRFPAGLKTLAIILSVLKAIPLVFGFIGIVLLAGLASDIDDDFGDYGFGLDGLLGAAIAIFVVIAIIGALLVGFQFAGAIKERPMMVFVPALIMSLLDSLFTIGAWSSYSESKDFQFQEQSAFGPVLMTVITGVQIYVAVQAIRANSN